VDLQFHVYIDTIINILLDIDTPEKDTLIRNIKNKYYFNNNSNQNSNINNNYIINNEKPNVFSKLNCKIDKNKGNNTIIQLNTNDNNDNKPIEKESFNTTEKYIKLTGNNINSNMNIKKDNINSNIEYRPWSQNNSK